MAAAPARASAFTLLLVIGLVGCSTPGSTSSPGTAGPLRWERVVVSAEDWAVTALAVADDQVVALVSGDPSSVWSSTDAHTWQKEFEFAANEYPSDISPSANGFVVVGATEQAEAHTGGPMVPTVWTSPDGRTWAAHDVSLDVGFEYAAVGPQGTLLAIGNCADAKPSQGQRLCGCYMTDAGTWAPADTTQTEGGMVHDVMAGGPGFVAVGQLMLVEQPRQGMVWTSPDGQVWEPAPDDGAFLGAMLNGVAANDGDIVVVGIQFLDTGGTAPVAWHSEDGSTWSAMTMEDDSAGAQGAAGWTLNRVARLTDGTLVVVGLVGDIWTSAEFDLLAAVSSDGSTWVRVPEITSPLKREEATNDYGLKTVEAMVDGVIVGGADRGAVVWIGEH